LQSNVTDWSYPFFICYGKESSKVAAGRAGDPEQHPFNGPLSGTSRVSRYQKGKTNLDFTEARDSEWQWHQLAYASLHVAPDRHHANTPPLSFLQAGCSSCRPTNSVKALKASDPENRRKKFSLLACLSHAGEDNSYQSAAN